MLVLTRKRTEMIKIGEDIVITVIHTSRGSVKLGIQAPSDVRVLRSELDQRPLPGEAAVDVDSDDDEEMVGGVVVPATLFSNPYSAEFVAAVEDQALLSLSK